MSKVCNLILLCPSIIGMVCITFPLPGQTPGEWTWMHGNNTANPTSVFGTKGVPSPSNRPPALYEPCEWKDNNGNFWIFGGRGSSGVYAALWTYDPTTNEWTWMNGPSAVNQPGIYGIQGIPSSVNYPCSRGYGVATWVDAAGDLWLFGGTKYTGVGNDFLNDLWKYSISTDEWTWMKGSNITNDPGNYGTMGVSAPTNIPPSRWETSSTWTDNVGNLWLYGGGASSGDCYSDLWKYTPATNQWTWMQGSNVLNSFPVHGTQGVPSPANTPGGRYVYCSWTDQSGDLWLFAGQDSTSDKANDLWKYDIISNQWTWIKGANTVNSPGSYGTKCQGSATNEPPARYENRARVRDGCGNFWNFGGDDSAGKYLNDLWHFNTNTNQWTWISGDNTTNQPSVYGTKGISSPTVKPGGRKGNVAWMDNNGHIWLFGGESSTGLLNDMFRYVPDPNCVPVLSSTLTVSPNTTVCIGQNVTLSAAGNIGYVWSPGGQTTASIVVNNTTSTTYTVTGSSFCNSNTATVSIIVIPPPAASISGDDTICSGESSLISVTGGINYLWGTGQNNTSISVSPAATTVYTSTVSIGNCSSSTSFTVTVIPIPIVNAFSDTTILEGGSTTLGSSSNGLAASYDWSPAEGLSCSTCPNPVASPTITTTFCVVITDINDCKDSACVTITIQDSCSVAGMLYLPNTFSPNNDGENDTLRVYLGNTNCIQDFELYVFDRWGRQVFSTLSPTVGWDGNFRNEKVNNGVFTYYLRASLVSGKLIYRKGNASLIR